MKIPALVLVPALAAPALLAGCAAPGPAPTMRGFAVSRTEFRDGDSLEIDEVRGTHDTFVEGGVYRVRGRYTLASAERAHLALTTTNGRTEGEKEKDVERGTGNFDFTFRLVEVGYPHLWMAPVEGGESFADLWFGTEGTQFLPDWEHHGSWGPAGWVDRGDTGFAFEGDGIEVERVSGPEGPFAVGPEYTVRGRYTLGSRAEAYLALYCTNGELDGEHGLRVRRGSGTFEFTFRIARMGRPHVSFYPPDGGSGFGNLYFDPGGRPIR